MIIKRIVRYPVNGAEHNLLDPSLAKLALFCYHHPHVNL
jgi:hypothetical protein